MDEKKGWVGSRVESGDGWGGVSGGVCGGTVLEQQF